MDFGHHHHHHHHHNDQPLHSADQPTVRIFTKADESYCLSVRNGHVVLAPANPRDEFQHWIKDMRHGTRVKDEEGFPAFALVNKATGLAIKHSVAATNPVALVPYNPELLDQSVLWSESRDTGEGFKCIRMVNNIGLNFDAFNGDEDHGGVRDGTPVVLWEWLKGKNQRWKILPWSTFSSSNNAGLLGGELGVVTRKPTVRVFTKADENYSLTARDGNVVLALTNPRDQHQHWFKDFRYANEVKDDEGFPSFALVNVATNQAIKHSIGGSHPVRLVPYNPDYLDESVLWTESGNTGEGFRCIRMVNNTRLNLDAFNGDEDHGGVHDGTPVVLWEWLKGKNQMWKIVPYY